MNSSYFIDGAKYVSTKDAGSSVGYTHDYVARLAREGKVKAKRVGAQWVVDGADVKEFASAQQTNRALRGSRMSAIAQTKRNLSGQGFTYGAARKETGFGSYAPEHESQKFARSSATFKNRTASLANMRTRIDAARPVPSMTPSGLISRVVTLLIASSFVFGLYGVLDKEYARFVKKEAQRSTTFLVHEVGTFAKNVPVKIMSLDEAFGAVATDPLKHLANVLNF